MREIYNGKLVEIREDIDGDELLKDILNDRLGLKELCEKHKANFHTVRERVYKLKMSYYDSIMIKEILTRGENPIVLFIDNKYVTVNEYCKMIGLKPISVYQRIKRGWTDEELIADYYNKKGRK